MELFVTEPTIHQFKGNAKETIFIWSIQSTTHYGPITSSIQIKRIKNQKQVSKERQPSNNKTLKEHNSQLSFLPLPQNECAFLLE